MLQIFECRLGIRGRDLCEHHECAIVSVCHSFLPNFVLVNGEVGSSPRITNSGLIADFRVRFRVFGKGEISCVETANLAAVRMAKMCYTVARQNRKPPKTPENAVKTREIVLHANQRDMELRS